MIRNILFLLLVLLSSLATKASVNISVFADHISDVARQQNISLREAAQKVYDTGVRGVDVFVTIRPEELQVLDEVGFQHATAILVTDFIKGECTEDIERSISFAKEHHFDQLMLVPGFMPKGATSELYELVYRRIGQLVKQAKKAHIIVTVEDYDDIQSPCYNTESLDRMFKKCPSLKMTFDTGNFLNCNEDIMTACIHFLKKIRHVHLKDRRAVGPSEVVPVGTGAVPLHDVITTLKSHGYDGWYTIEFFGSKHMLNDIRSSVNNIHAADSY